MDKRYLLHAAAQAGASLRKVLPAMLVVINLLQHFSVVFSSLVMGVAIVVVGGGQRLALQPFQISEALWLLTCHDYLPTHSNLSQCFFYQAAQADLWLRNLQLEADESPPESRVLYQLCRQPQMPEQKTTRISFIIFWDLASEPWFTSCDYQCK